MFYNSTLKKLLLLFFFWFFSVLILFFSDPSSSSSFALVYPASLVLPFPFTFSFISISSLFFFLYDTIILPFSFFSSFFNVFSLLFFLVIRFYLFIFCVPPLFKYLSSSTIPPWRVFNPLLMTRSPGSSASSPLVILSLILRINPFVLSGQMEVHLLNS